MRFLLWFREEYHMKKLIKSLGALVCGLALVATLSVGAYTVKDHLMADPGDSFIVKQLADPGDSFTVQQMADPGDSFAPTYQ